MGLQLVIPRQLELVPRLQCLACHCNHDRIAVSGAQCLAGIINKIPDGMKDLSEDNFLNCILLRSVIKGCIP